MFSTRAATIFATFAFLLAGCGSDTEASAPASAPDNKLDASACTELTDANLDLATATTAEQAKAAADVFSRYQPSADAQQGIDHVVAAGGVKFDDADLKMISNIDAWVSEVCPE